ncbi:hypothetical protein [Hyphomicrobium sp. ghe19]|uniref:hypothetical protein n=1 Tax=Hyphomicrobium sp. ghe19 TaxID=2682968 RepID=UPI0030D48AE4
MKLAHRLGEDRARFRMHGDDVGFAGLRLLKLTALGLELVEPSGQGARVAAGFDRSDDALDFPLDGRQVALDVAAVARHFFRQALALSAVRLYREFDEIGFQQIFLQRLEHSRRNFGR